MRGRCGCKVGRVSRWVERKGKQDLEFPLSQQAALVHTCTTEALEIKRAASSICLRRIVALCGLGVYVVRPGVYGVPSQQILYSVRPSRAKTGFPAHSVVQTGYTTPTLRFSDTLLAAPLVVYIH